MPDAVTEAPVVPAAPVTPPAPAAPVADPKVAPDPKADPPKVDAKPPEPKVDMTAKFLALSKREKAIVEQEKKSKAELAAREAEIAAKAQKFADIEALLAAGSKKDYAAILKRTGVSYEDLTKWFIAGGKEATEAQDLLAERTKPLEEKITAQEKKLQEIEAAAKKAAEERAAAEQKQQAEATRNFVNDKIKADPRFELLALNGESSKVYDAMVEVVAAEPARADTPEKAAALMIELATLMEAEVLAEHEKLSAATKLKKAAAPAVEPKDGEKPSNSAAAPERLRKALATLEGKDLLAAPPVQVSTRPKTRAERIAEIAAAVPDGA